MPVRQRSNGWQADFSFAAKRYRKDGFATKEEAELWELERRQQLRDGAEPESSGNSTVTMQQVFDLTFARYWEGSKGEKTARINGEDVVRRLGAATPITAISTASIDSLITQLRTSGNANGTINRKLAALSKMLRLASDRGWIEKMPRVGRLKEAEHRLRWLTDEEEGLVIDWFTDRDDTDMADLVAFLLDTGLRLSEAINVNAKRDIRHGKLYVWGDGDANKSGRTRAIPLTARAAEIAVRAGDSPFGAMSKDGVDKAWARMRKAIGLKDDVEFVVHALRHTFATRLIRKGVPVAVVQRLMGHRDIKTTMRYAHVAEQDLDEAIRKLEMAA